MIVNLYLPYLNKFVDQYNNTYYYSISKKPINNDYSALTQKKLKRITKLLNFKLMTESELLSIRMFFVKVTLKIGQEIFIINSVLKTNPWAYRIKDLNGEKIVGSFYDKELLLSKL